MIRALMIKGTPEGLNFIDEDITLMRQVFDELGISNEMISGNRYDVLKKLLNIIECIDRTESIIVYYTGHGVVKNGKFQLKLEKEEKKSNYLPIEELFSTISEARNNKVAIILDCCNAGAAINEWKKDICEKHSLFLASGSIENAKEIVEFRASFFTYYIYKAIMSKQDKLLLNGKILLSKLHEVVIEYTKRYNNDNDCNMPLPELFGSRNIDFRR